MEWIFLAVAAAPIVWSVTRFRRLDLRSREFRHGLLGFGLSLWVLLTVVLAYGAWQADPRHTFSYFVVYFGLTRLPACLWSGYWWVRAMRSDYLRFRGFGSSSRS